MKPLVDTALRYHTFKGTIKKDLIPPELELGDYWYNFYFDEPYLLEESSVGRPIYVNSLQIAEPTDGFFNLEDFIGKHVQVSGNFGWGYAESTTIESIAITEL
ncbi:hypothetical protein A3K34_01850 [candidate division WWE3 bacterium RIFOXYC1_FULL_40_10]|uniref:Uncharacterized protein n=1 Tax=candidate division WWE3 bacterium RIFOXYA2_FULL_46_9 TaxID=1802636 RepID=A0A1F4W2K5_UNCKA|nr:MAG: hypothetical protein A3K58_01850 [candidate division WWE3 bacterium RIFOXYB1_FULL_40_22]OGC61607.1 MAG: hypothetical protein A3K37_01850 [candidate division WWE3 bacterium RIFOXYA1_FULL_40_11]OGC63654.1 MAG: hypothetical protein A2264_04795 [candidate division WWE3 bacterium RIFOXYA2_FULL_46_9]OGC64714.1 MAG: hypothetical protein A2326_01595 [candidate division WWE3 bacterium RIFOXYB2_FULL_41_6]OGC65990.1 MAG: hypothetical protein A3K34_01850 [candidate division WWE3 bacterium RIFOXYC1_